MGNKNQQNFNWSYLQPQPFSPIDLAIKSAQTRATQTKSTETKTNTYQNLPQPPETPKLAFIKEAGVPVIELLYRNLKYPTARYVDTDVTETVPKHSAENMKNQLDFMISEFLADKNKGNENPYINIEDYFNRVGVESVTLPFSVFDKKVTTKIPTPSMEFVEALDRLNQPKDYSMSKFTNFLDNYNSDYFNTSPVIEKFPGVQSRYRQFYESTTGKKWNGINDPSKVRVGKYDWVIGKDGIARVSDDYDFDLTDSEIWKLLKSGKPNNIGRVLLQPFLGGKKLFTQTLEIPVFKKDKD